MQVFVARNATDLHVDRGCPSLRGVRDVESISTVSPRVRTFDPCTRCADDIRWYTERAQVSPASAIAAIDADHPSVAERVRAEARRRGVPAREWAARVVGARPDATVIDLRGAERVIDLRTPARSRQSATITT